MTWPGLPILVRLAGRPVILLGEGEAAEAKRRLLERAGATVVADHPDARLAIVAIDDEAAAQARSKYIQESIKSMPMLGQEYHSIKGSALLRVDGNVKPSIASTYSGTF